MEYFYRVPLELVDAYEGREWERFRVFEDINRYKNDNYSNDLLAAVERELKAGYSPFTQQKILLEKYKHGAQKIKEWTITQALHYFIQVWEERGLESATMAKYKHAKDLLLKWLIHREMQNLDINILSRQHIELFLSENKKTYLWSNRHYNNIKTFLRTGFSFLVKNDICRKNPCADIDKLKSVSKKHRYYDERTLKLVMDEMKASDPYLYFAAQVVYHLCIRSEKELKLFRVGGIVKERKQVMIRGEDSKTNMDRYIPMSDEILKIFEERKVFDYPPEYFVFGVPHKNKFVAEGLPGATSFGSGFFSKRFAKVRRTLNLGSDYTLFGFRHTRCVHLKLDGAKDESIMQLMGHTDFATTAKYLRDLGLQTDPDAINSRTRKI